MKKSKVEDYLIILSEILLILIFVLLFLTRHYVYGIVFFIGALVMYLYENDILHLVVFWGLIIIGSILILILGNFLFGTVLILFAIAELYLNNALNGYHT